MNNFILASQSILSKYRVDAIMLTLAVLTTFIAVGLLFVPSSSASMKSTPTLRTNTSDQKPKQYIVVDIQGAIKKPDAYSIEIGARLKDILKIAGGLSPEADQTYFAQNFNLAEKLSDEQKLYIPSKRDVDTGLLSSNMTSSSSDANHTTSIDLNSASREQLDSLPGIGTITVDKIIANRPYTTPDQLLTNKILTQSVYDKIKGLVTAI